MVKNAGKGGGGKKGDKSPSTDKRKPKHSGDANRPSKSVNGQRDASTVSLPALFGHVGAANDVFRWCRFSPLFPPSRLPLTLASNAVLHRDCPFPFQVRRLAMYKKRPIRDKRGKVLHEVRRRGT